MNKLIDKRVSIFNNKGLTLIELIVALAILTTISAIAVPSFMSYIEYSKENVCSLNRQMILKEYHLYMVMDNKEHSNMLLEEFVQANGHNICPNNGVISVVDDDVLCNIHVNEQKGSDNGDDEEVPYL